MSQNPFRIVQDQATSLAESGKRDAAIEALERLVGPPLIASDRESQDAQRYLATLYGEAGRTAEAELLCRGLLTKELSPITLVQTHETLAALLEDQGFVSEARTQRELMASAITQLTDEPLRLFCEGVVAQERGAHETAFALFQRATKFFAESVVYERSAAKSALLAGRWTDAILHGTRVAVSTAPFFELREGAHAVALSQLGLLDLKAAADWTAHALRLARSAGTPAAALEAYSLAALLLLQQGRLSDALELADTAIAVFPDDAYGLVEVRFLGLMAEENFEAAAEALEQLTQLDAAARANLRRKRTPLRDRHRAWLARATGDTESALVLLTLAEEGFGEDTRQRYFCQTQRVITLATSGDHDGAQALLTALEPETNSAERRRLFTSAAMQAALLRQDYVGAITQAKERLRTGVAPVDEPFVWLTLGDAYAGHNELSAARFAWNKAADHSAEVASVGKAQQRLSMPEM